VCWSTVVAFFFPAGRSGYNSIESISACEAALDSISLIDPSRDEQMERALGWLIDHHEKDGLWKATYVSGKAVDNARTRETRLWVSLAICRVLRRMSSQDS
jgi:hypothetical protein